MKPPVRPRGLCTVLLFALPLFLTAQNLPPSLSVFSPEEYGGASQVFCMEELDGRSFFGTHHLVAVHDGEDFSEIPVGVGKAVLSMGKDKEGRLFLGGQSLMGMLVPDSTGTLTYRSLMQLLPDSLQDFGIIWDTWCDPEGGVYFNARDRVFHYDGDSVTSIRPSSKFSWMFSISGESVIVDLDSGLFRLEEGGKVHLKGSSPLVEGKDVQAILPSAQGQQDGAWTVFTRHDGIYDYDPKSGKVERWGTNEEGPPKKLFQDGIYSATRLDPNMNPYGASYAVGTQQDGIHLLDPLGRSVLHLSREDGLPAKRIWQVRSDGRGNVWGTTDKGIALLHTGVPFTLISEGRIYDGNIQDIARSTRGDAPLFLATSQGAWVYRQEEGEEGFSFLKGSEGQVWDLLFLERKGEEKPRPLVAGGKKGLLRMDAGPVGSGQEPQLRPLMKQRPQAYTLDRFPSAFHSGDDDGVIMGGRDGLFVLLPPDRPHEQWKKRLAYTEIPERILSVGWDTLGLSPDSLRIWAGLASKGLLALRTDTAFNGFHVTRYDSSDAFSPGPVWVNADPVGQGCLFGNNGGLLEFRDGEVTPVCRFGELFCDGSRPVQSVQAMLDSSVLIHDNMGGQIKRSVLGSEGVRVDSLPFRFLDIGTIRAIHPEKGRVWFGGDQGLASYHPGVEKDYDASWSCRIREVKGAGDTLLFGGTYSREGRKYGKARIPVGEQPKKRVPVLPYSENRFLFGFAAAFPDRQDMVRYKYKLDGFDTAWSKFTHKTEKEYTNLPEGEYSFKVKAENVYAKESGTPEYRFRILPPWYRTWTAYGGYSMGGIAFLWLLLWLNGRRLIAQKQRLERVVTERTREIRDKKEELERKNQALENANRIISEQKDEVEEAHKEITQSIDYAQKIQYALLQNEEYVSPHLPEHFVLFKPQSQVSGDFYWAKEHKGSFYIAAVDCTGHGVPGAFMSMLGISQLNEIMNTDEELSPGYILTELRDRVVRELSGSDPESAAKDGMDAAILRIANSNSNPNPNSKEEGGSRREAVGSEGVEVEFAGAQNPLYVIRRGIGEEPPSPSMEGQGEGREGHVGSAREPSTVNPFKKSPDGIQIKGDPMPVGYDEYAKGAFTTVALQLRKDDMLYIFSDGYADQFGGPKGKKFRYGPFKQLLTELHEKSLEEQKKELDRTFEDWKAESEQEQIDDVVVVGVRL